MAFDVNLLVVHVAKIDKDDVDDRCHLELDVVVAFVDDGCSDLLCCCERCPDDDLLRDVEVEDVELDCQRCLLCNSVLYTCC